ncbi:MAG: Peptide deformylase 1 [Fimbriimonadaceae bacterium]|nr:Peptide deformylase 1 [Fimbriimonadaceae bacterium]
MDWTVPDEFRYLYEPKHTPEIIKHPSALLRKPAIPIDKIGKRLEKLIDSMVRTMKQAHGIGLAAPQIGESDRIIVIAPQGEKILVLLNPVITEAAGEVSGEEGCLSIPGLYGDVVRAAKVKVEAYDRKGKPVAYEMEGLPARVVQHEVDHLDGILFIDKVDVESLHWAHPIGGEE